MAIMMLQTPKEKWDELLAHYPALSASMASLARSRFNDFRIDDGGTMIQTRYIASTRWWASASSKLEWCRKLGKHSCCWLIQRTSGCRSWTPTLLRPLPRLSTASSGPWRLSSNTRRTLATSENTWRLIMLVRVVVAVEEAMATSQSRAAVLLLDSEVQAIQESATVAEYPGTSLKKVRSKRRLATSIRPRVWQTCARRIIKEPQPELLEEAVDLQSFLNLPSSQSFCRSPSGQRRTSQKKLLRGWFFSCKWSYGGYWMAGRFSSITTRM